MSDKTERAYAVVLLIFGLCLGRILWNQEKAMKAVENPPLSVTTPVKNPITGTESPLSDVQRPGESRDEFFDRVIADVLALQERLAKGK